MGHDELSHLAPLARAYNVRVSEMDPGVYAGVDDLLNSFVKGSPLTGDAGKCDRDRHLRILAEE